MHVPLVFTIVANNGIMVIPSLPHGSTKTILMRNYQSKNWGLIHRKPRRLRMVSLISTASSSLCSPNLSIPELGFLKLFHSFSDSFSVSGSAIISSSRMLLIKIHWAHALCVDLEKQSCTAVYNVLAITKKKNHGRACAVSTTNHRAREL